MTGAPLATEAWIVLLLTLAVVGAGAYYDKLSREHRLPEWYEGRRSFWRGDRDFYTPEGQSYRRLGLWLKLIGAGFFIAWNVYAR